MRGHTPRWGGYAEPSIPFPNPAVPGVAAPAAPAPPSSYYQTHIQPYEAGEQLAQRVHLEAVRNQADSTHRQYASHQREFIAWAHQHYHSEPAPSTVTEHKLARWLADIAQRKRRKRKGKDAFEELDQVVGYQTVSAASNAIVALYKLQVTQRINGYPHPRGHTVKLLMQNLQLDTARRKRENFDNKKHVASEGYTAEEHAQICHYHLSVGTFAGLRSLVAHLVSHMCMLRSDSARMVELSDIYQGTMGEAGSPGAAAYLAIALRQSKVNRTGRVEYVGLLRHVNPAQCGVFAIALFLFQRFHLRTEAFPDLSSNRSWYLIKLLCSDNDSEAAITYSNHHHHVSKAFQQLGLRHLPKVTHASRGSGAREAESKGVSQAEIERMGHWKDVSSALQQSYLTTLPLATMRALAGFDKGQEYFIARAMVDPPDALLRQIFPQADAWLTRLALVAGAAEPVEAARSPHSSAGSEDEDLDDIYVLQKVQPAHPVLRHPLFRSDSFRSWRQEQDRRLAAIKPPVLQTLQQVAPAIAQQMDASHSAMRGGFERNDANLAIVQNAVGSLESTLANQSARQAASLQEISTHLNRFAAHMTHQQLVLNAHRKETGALRHHLSAFFDQLASASTDSAQGLRSGESSAITSAGVCDNAAIDAPPAPGNGATSILAAPSPLPALELPAVSLAAPTSELGQELIPPSERYAMSPHVKTVRDLWEEYDVGLDGQLPLRQVEAEFGVTWCGGSKSAKRKQFVRRMVIIKRIEAADPEKRADILDELARAAGNHSLDWLRKQIEAGKV
ncbi:unnamed protein product [Parajaminaea phylloscopi]